MRWIEAKVTFESPNPQLTAELIANIFYEIGLKGVVLDDPHLEPAEGWGDNAIPLPVAYGVTGYFPDSRTTGQRCTALESAVAKLVKRQNDQWTYDIIYRRMDEEEWAEAWKEFFWPQKVTPTLVVKPTWRDYAVQKDDIVIEIDPGMAFGTGTHATTALCMQMIEKYLHPEMDFLDIGTGSGILLIAAAKLGARRLTGIDNDEVAVTVARENLVLNQIDPEQYEVVAGSLVEKVKERYQMVVANILSEIILELLDDIQAVLAPGALFIASGIIDRNKPAVLAKMKSKGLRILEEKTQEEWVAIVARAAG